MYFITWVLITGTSLTYPSGDGTAIFVGLAVCRQKQYRDPARGIRAPRIKPEISRFAVKRSTNGASFAAVTPKAVTYQNCQC